MIYAFLEDGNLARMSRYGDDNENSGYSDGQVFNLTAKKWAAHPTSDIVFHGTEATQKDILDWCSRNNIPILNVI